jgi:acyl carrier protein phosphodiesterase
MNFLAHLFLADDNAESMIGNLAGDFVKGPLRDRFSDAVRAGIANHRAVDAFTDSHPSVAAMRRVVTPEHGHYSRVINDVFIDHFLATAFDELANETLESFLDRVYAHIDPHANELPGALRFVYPRMRDEQWLLSYRDIEGINEALTNMSFRLSRRPHLEHATHHLVDSRAELKRHFRAFWTDVVRWNR